MKEKTKKVIKTLGVGALLCAGAFTFAGCSLNAEDKALVENKVAELQQQLAENNALLEEQNNLINQQLLVDRAWGLIQTALAELLINIDGVRDNLVMEYTLAQETSIQVFYKTSSGDYVFAQDNHVVYEDNSGMYSYRYNDKDDLYEKVKLGDWNSMEVYFVEELNSFNFVGDATKENITSVEILNNGDYKITIVYNRNKELEYTSQQVATILELVISPDGKCSSIKKSNMDIQKWEGNDDEGDETSAWIYKDGMIEFKYGAVDVEEVLTKLEEAKACPVK